MSPPAPDDVVRRIFEARAVGDVRQELALVDPAARPHLAPAPASARRVEIEAHRFEIEDAEHVLVHGRVRVFEGGSLADSPAAWRFTVRAGRVVAIEPVDGERRRLRRVA